MADQLHGIEINLDRSSNPKIYFLLERPELGQHVRAFLKENDLRITSAGVRDYESSTNPTQIKLEGPSDSVMKFVAEYLSDDPPIGVYRLIYRESRDSGCQPQATAKSFQFVQRAIQSI
jgi:hypothetical protein